MTFMKLILWKYHANNEINKIVSITRHDCSKKIRLKAIKFDLNSIPIQS